MTSTSQRIPPDFEWKGFIQRNNNVLIDPNGPKRSIENIGFANQDHPSTRPLIAGSLERKGKMLKRYETGYYVVTPSKYLHEFKSDDDFARDPSPENSLYLPDCLIGSVSGTDFNVKGKDSSKGAMSKMSMSHEFSFKAHTPEDARKWHDVISSVAGGASGSMPSSPSVASQGGTPFTAHTQSPTSPTQSSMTTGSTAHESSYPPSSMEKDRDLAGNPVVPSERDASTPTGQQYPGPTGGQMTSARQNDYAPL